MSLLQPLNLAMPSCADCRFCQVDIDLVNEAKKANLKAPDQGVCVRFPPHSQLVGSPQGGVSAVMVKTVIPLTHWCGEFKDKRAQQ